MSKQEDIYRIEKRLKNGLGLQKSYNINRSQNGKKIH